MSPKSLTQSQSPGYPELTYTQVPDEILDGMGSRPYTETLVLLYIARRTFGFKRQDDAVSYDQFINGITKRDGKVLDTGCGIKSRTTLSSTIKSLESQGLIVVERTKKGNEKQTTVYRLKLKEGSPSAGLGVPGVVHLADYRSPSAGLGVVREMDIQETVQDTGYKKQSPLPPEGEAATPPGDSPPIEGMANPESGSLQPEKPASTPLPPASVDLERAEARMVDAGRRFDSESRGRMKHTDDNGWSTQPPERLENIQSSLWDVWREKNAERIARKDLPLIAQSVAPDEVMQFQTQTNQYLKSVDDPRYLKKLRTWLEEWRDWIPSKIVSKPAETGVYAELEVMKRMGRTRKLG